MIMKEEIIWKWTVVFVSAGFILSEHGKIKDFVDLKQHVLIEKMSEGSTLTSAFKALLDDQFPKHLQLYEKLAKKGLLRGKKKEV